MEEANAQLTAPGKPFETCEVVIRGERMMVWKSAPATFRDIFQMGAAHGDRTFIVLEDERISFTAFTRATVNFADALVAGGLRRGDRVAIAMRNLPEWAVAFFGTILAGGIATPLNAWWKGGELVYALNDSAARVLVADADRLVRLAPHRAECGSLERIFSVRVGEMEGAEPIETLLGDPGDWANLPARALPDVPLDTDDDATIFYTSGTSGHPKGALGTHRNMLTTLMSNAFLAARAALRDGVSDQAMGERVLLLAVPLFHMVGCVAHLVPALAGGCKLVMMRKWEVGEGLRLIEEERVTDAGGVPANTIDLLDHAAKSGRDVSSLTGMSYGGAPSRPEMVAELARTFPNVRPATGWGMTETSGAVSGQMGGDLATRPASCGAPIPIWQMKVVGPNGEALPTGSTGELLVKGAGLVRGYWNKPEATEAAFVDGWLRTGDVARFDAEGFCYLLDRAKDVIIRGGENIYSVEVENVLGDHPAVAEAALLPVPHRVMGEEPVAIVRLRPETKASDEELRDFARSRLAAFKVPVRIIFRDEPFPRNAAGKIVKAELKGELA